MKIQPDQDVEMFFENDTTNDFDIINIIINEQQEIITLSELKAIINAFEIYKKGVKKLNN